MAHTYTSGPFNSTPFSSCCGVASMDRSGKPDAHCHKCGEAITHHNASFDVAEAQRLERQGRCGLCGQKRHDCNC